MGVWMHCVRTDEGKEKKKRKEKPWMTVVDVGRQECRCVACADVLRVHMDAYEQKKNKKTYLWDCQGCACRGTGIRMTTLACGRGCVACGCG